MRDKAQRSLNARKGSMKRRLRLLAAKWSAMTLQQQEWAIFEAVMAQDMAAVWGRMIEQQFFGKSVISHPSIVLAQRKLAFAFRDIGDRVHIVTKPNITVRKYRRGQRVHVNK